MFTCFIDFAVNAGNFTEPHMAFLVFHVENRVDGPVKVIRDVCDFLIKLITWIRSDRSPNYPGPDWPLPPSVSTAPVTISTSISWLHLPHVT